MQNIYIILMHTNTMPSNFVKLFTKYKYSHVAISLTKDCYITYSFGRRSLYNILNGGFSIQKKDGEFFRKFNNTNCKIYEIQVTDEQYEQIRQRLDNMEENSTSYKYDFLGCGLRWLGMPVTFENRYVCSYFIANVLEEAKVCEFEKDTSFIVPKDFENIYSENEIYAGRYLSYL